MSGWDGIERAAELRRQVRRDRERMEAELPAAWPLETMPRVAAALAQGHGRMAACAALLYLYAPMSLAGGKVPGRTAREMAAALGTHPCYVTRKKHVTLFLYRRDEDFRREVDQALETALRLLGGEENDTGHLSAT